MKNYFMLLSGLMLTAIVLFSACSQSEEPKPCDNKGNLWIVNKMDSAVIVTVLPLHEQFTMQVDDETMLTLNANQSYTINMVYTGFNQDSVILINSCDNKIFVME